MVRFKELQTELGKVTLAIVTKNQSIDAINALIKQGATLIAENKVQEALSKFPFLLPVQKHLIGHLQSNKVRKAVQLFDCIQSVDSIKLAMLISDECMRLQKIMPVMLEVQFEEQKFGFRPYEVIPAYEQIKALSHIKVVGLMCLAPYTDPEQTRPIFQAMRKLNATLNLAHLSMGTSNDYQIAIEEGSTMVRIGTKLFKG